MFSLYYTKCVIIVIENGRSSRVNAKLHVCFSLRCSVLWKLETEKSLLKLVHICGRFNSFWRHILDFKRSVENNFLIQFHCATFEFLIDVSGLEFLFLPSVK